MSLSYEFSIGSVRARETSLFSDAEVEQMLAMKGEGELVRFLRDKGYGDGSSVAEILESSRQKMWKYIRSVAPDFSVFDPFLIQNDVHNLKTILKGVMSDREYQELLTEPCTVQHSEMISIVENRRFDKLPGWLGEAADKAYQLLAETKDARISDALIDKAVMERMLFEGKMSRSAFLDEYFRTVVFYANVKIALRGAKADIGQYYFENALCECEGFDKAAVTRFALMGSGHLVKYLEKLGVYDCSKAMALFQESPSLFERFVDNQLIRLAKKLCRYASEGPEALMGYYIGCQYERKLITMVAGGLKTGTAPEKIRERLRELYG